jgi:antirestriction protein ArdC
VTSTRTRRPAAPKNTDTVYEMITERVIAALESGQAPWRKPWHAATDGPRNIVSGRVYRGMNVWLLLSAGYDSPYWLTFNQAKQARRALREGQHGTVVIFWKMLKVRRHRRGRPDLRQTVPMLRYFRVFNLEQTEGIDAPEAPHRRPRSTRSTPLRRSSTATPTHRRSTRTVGPRTTRRAATRSPSRRATRSTAPTSSTRPCFTR